MKINKKVKKILIKNKNLMISKNNPNNNKKKNQKKRK